MKIDSSVSAAMAMAQQYLRQHEVYMAQAAHRMNNQGDEGKDLTVHLSEQERKKHSTVVQDNPSVLMADTALHTITTSLLHMRDNLLQAIAEAENTQKISTALNNAHLQQPKKLIFDYTHTAVSDSLSKSRELDSKSSDSNTDSANDPVDMGRTALSTINAALQQISNSKTALYSMHLQMNTSSLPVSPASIMNSDAAKERSEQTKAQIWGEANKSMQSQANQNPIALYSLL